MELPFFTTTASSSTNTKAEALRWLAIAEKLLAGRDLVGSKSFAARARESDPSLLYADQIIAVVDTLIAGDNRINNQPDWYSILQVAGNQTRDSELISGQYRKLTFLLNPQKNRLPYADQAFNLVMNAWSVLSNPSAKAIYDNQFMGHLSVNSQGASFSNPILSGVGRDQVNYQPFEINFQVMPPPQQQQQQQQGMFREQLNQQFPPHHASLDPLPRPLPQVNVARDQVQQRQQPQPPPQLHPQPQPQLQPQPQIYQQLPQTQPWSQNQPQQQQQQTQVMGNWMGVTQNLSGSTGEVNEEINNNIAGAPNNNNENQNVNVERQEVREETARNESSPSDDENSNFWTACPYCFYMYEYPSVYAECTLRCQNKKCGNAFHGVVIPSPPPILKGQDAYFCCWGTIPMGISMTVLERHMGTGGNNWSPFSPMFTCPKGPGNNGNASNVNLFGGSNVNNNGQGSGGGNRGGRKSSGPRVYAAADDVYVEFSESSEESDADWRNDKGKRKTRGVKRTGTTTASRNVRKSQVDKGKNFNKGGSDNVPDGFVPQEAAAIPTVPVTEDKSSGATDSGKKGVYKTSKTVAPANSRRQSARVAKNYGSLDLNVEFSNEAEEPVYRVSQGNGSGRREEEIIEGAGFFEGLDEFFSSLPILNVVGDKVKAA